MTAWEYELKDLPRQLAYEESRFGNMLPYIVGAGPGCATIDQVARAKHAALIIRQAELKKKLRRWKAGDRWVRWKERQENLQPSTFNLQPSSPLTPMLMDEVIQGRRIVDDWR